MNDDRSRDVCVYVKDGPKQGCLGYVKEEPKQDASATLLR
jgi:hypothetical protein